MFKLTTFFFLLIAFNTVCAQHYYNTLKQEHLFNELQDNLKKSPNNDTLILKKLLLVADRNFIYEDPRQEYTFNFELYDYEARLKDINDLLAKQKSYTIGDTLYQHLDLMYMRAQIHLSEAKDESVTADYKTIINYLQNNIADYDNEFINTKLIAINDYFQEFSFYIEEKDNLKFYKQQHLDILNNMLIIGKTTPLDKNNPLLHLEINHLGQIKANLLKDLGQIQNYIDYIPQLMLCIYENVLNLKASANYDDIFLLEENQNNLSFYASQLALAYYELKDFKNAQLWAEAYLKDMSTIFNTKSLEDLIFYGVQDYSYKIHELLFNLAISDKNQDLKLIVKQLKPLIGEINSNIDYNAPVLEAQINTLITKYPKSGELSALYLLFKFNNRITNYHKYKTYGKELLALIEKTEKLQGTIPNSNFIKAITYIEFENDKELGAFYLEKALKENSTLYYNSIEHIDDLKINYTPPIEDFDDFNDLPQAMELYNLKLPENIIKLLYKK